MPSGDLEFSDRTYWHNDLRVDGRVFTGPPESPAPVYIFLNGAVDRTSHSLPVFQRSSWARDISSNSIFVSDPTLGLSSTLAIGWGLGSRLTHGIEAMAVAISQWLSQISAEGKSGVPVFIGSSAGGFQALSLAARLGGFALAFNPQIRVSDYFRREVEEALAVSMGTRSIAEAHAEFPERMDCFDYWDHVGHFPYARIVINSASGDDMRRDFRRLLTSFEFRPECSTHVELAFYPDRVVGHNPPSKEITLREVFRAGEQALRVC